MFFSFLFQSISDFLRFGPASSEEGLKMSLCNSSLLLHVSSEKSPRRSGLGWLGLGFKPSLFQRLSDLARGNPHSLVVQVRTATGGSMYVFILFFGSLVPHKTAVKINVRRRNDDIYYRAVSFFVVCDHITKKSMKRTLEGALRPTAAVAQQL